METIKVIPIIVGIVFGYLVIGAFASIVIEFGVRQINANVNIDDDDRWKFIALWPVLLFICILTALGYFPFWLSKRLAEKTFKDKNS